MEKLGNPTLMRQQLLSIAQTIRLPSICVLCKQFHCNRRSVCSECMALLPAIGASCTYCAYPLPDDHYLVCGYCIKNPPYFDSATIAYRFEEPLRSLIHQFKYQEGLYLASFLGQLILNAKEKNASPDPECLIPVPMHPKKIKQRGFNQTLLLTRFLAKKLQINYDVAHCHKRVNTPPQAQMDRKKRAKNLREAFSVSKIPYQHVALIDDLLTTGSTLNELAKQLKGAGVTRVDIWCCARTVTHE